MTLASFLVRKTGFLSDEYACKRYPIGSQLDPQSSSPITHVGYSFSCDACTVMSLLIPFSPPQQMFDDPKIDQLEGAYARQILENLQAW